MCSMGVYTTVYTPPEASATGLRPSASRRSLSFYAHAIDNQRLHRRLQPLLRFSEIYEFQMVELAKTLSGSVS